MRKIDHEIWTRVSTSMHALDWTTFYRQQSGTSSTQQWVPSRSRASPLIRRISLWKPRTKQAGVLRRSLQISTPLMLEWRATSTVVHQTRLRYSLQYLPECPLTAVFPLSASRSHRRTVLSAEHVNIAPSGMSGSSGPSSPCPLHSRGAAFCRRAAKQRHRNQW